MFEESIAIFPNFRRDQEPGELSFSRADLDEVFSNPEYKPEDLLALLKKDFSQDYGDPVGVWEGYSLAEHTAMVLGQFEKYYGNKELPEGLDKNGFRLLLAVHDLGKPAAVRQDKKYEEHEYTARKTETIFYQLGFPKQDWQLAKALIMNKFLGQYLKSQDIDANRCFAEILGSAQDLAIKPEKFFKLLEIYYKVDASSYTEEAGGQKSLDDLFIFDKENKNINLAPELEAKVAPLREKFKKHQEGLDENQKKIEGNDLYKNIAAEMDAVEIGPDNKDRWGCLLAPNGKTSELPEKEWKMTRTPSFKNWFGDWQAKYSEADFAHWLKYQEIRRRQEWIHDNEEYIEERSGQEFYADSVKMYQSNNEKDREEIAALQAELDQVNFKPEESDYSKILDRNGEPRLVCRSSSWGLNEKGGFDAPFLKSEDWQGTTPFQLGIFLGDKSEAKHHLGVQTAQEQIPNMYYAFVNCRAPRFLDGKYFWNKEEKRIKHVQKHYDSFLVKDTSNRTERFSGSQANFIDLVVFNPDNVLVVEAK